MNSRIASVPLTSATINTSISKEIFFDKIKWMAPKMISIDSINSATNDKLVEVSANLSVKLFSDFPFLLTLKSMISESMPRVFNSEALTVEKKVRNSSMIPRIVAPIKPASAMGDYFCNLSISGELVVVLLFKLYETINNRLNNL